MAFESQKHVFWQALLLAVFVFAAGILLGFMLENWRTSKINTILAQNELDLLDIRIQSETYLLPKINCNDAINENINFANKLYEEGKILEKYEDSSQLSDAIVIQHKKQDLLRTLFWINAIRIKEQCNASYHNIVYLYNYNATNLELKAKQAVFSRVLSDLKEDMGNEIMLIPISGNTNLASINLMMGIYGINAEELPVILIDEKTKITEVQKAEDIKKRMQ